MGTQSTGLRFSVLGPLTVVREKERVDLGGRRPKALLATLLIAQGSVVTVPRLIEAIWGEQIPESALGTLHAYITKLRRALEPDRKPRTPNGVLDRQGPGYVLRIPPESVDAERFTALAEHGVRLLSDDPFAAAESLSAALALWRGPAYADLTDTDTAAAEIARLESARLSARQNHATARLAVGAAAEAVGDLEFLVREHPMAERSWELLALALYRCGRQGDALGALRTVRELLADELGVDPGAGLRAMEAAVLAQDPGLDWQAPTTESPVVAAGTTPDRDPAGAPPIGQPLPSPVTRLIGRVGDLAMLTRLLATHRLVTITGPGGSGKSRVALQVARDHAENAASAPGGDHDDRGGPWLALLADVTDPELLQATVGAAIGTTLVRSADELAVAIGAREALLVLDNCEHLVDAVAHLAEALLSRCAGLRLLATSREPLNITGEVTWEIPPLDPAGAAAELFTERVTAIRPGWRPDYDERATITLICRELDGLPLAIELAAAQSRALSLEQIAKGLSDRFTLLSDGSRTAPERHRSLEAAIESSVSLLTAQQRQLFGRLGLFEGGFDLEAAQWLAGNQPVLPRLGPLVAKSLVAVDGTATPQRYRMLETVRQYGLRTLTDEERSHWTDRHLAWAVELAETAARRLRTFDGNHWMHRLGHERANTRAALAHAFATGAADLALRLASAQSWYWYRSGNVHEGIGWLTKALDTADREHPGRGQALVGRAMLRYLAGAVLDGGQDVEQAIDDADRTGDIVVKAQALPYRAYFLQLTGDPGRAQEVLEEGMRFVRAASLPWLEAELMMIRGQITRAAGDPVLAAAQLVRAADIAEACGHDWAYGSSGWIGAKVAMDLGEADRAVQQAARLVTHLDETLDITSWLACAHVLAGALGMRGDAPGGGAMEGAVMLGAISAMGVRVGYFPEAMDPLDGPRNVALVRTALPPETYAEAMAMGTSLTTEDVTAMARRLIVAIPGDDGRRTVLRFDRS